MTNARRTSGFPEVSHTWKYISELNPKRSFAAAAAFNDKSFVVVGGETDGTRGLAAVSVYDRDDKSWTNVADIPTPRWDCAAAVVKGNVYVVGGRISEGEDTNSLQVLNTTDFSWSELEPMDMKLRGCAAAGYKNKFYVFGGYELESNSMVNSAFCYNAKNRAWERLDVMQCTRAYCATAVVGGSIYVLGGRGQVVGRRRKNKRSQQKPLRTCERFSLKEGKWVDEPALNTGMASARFQFAAVGIGRFVVVLGGKDSQGKLLNSIEVYDTQAKEWRSFSGVAMNFPRSAFSAVTLSGGRVVVVGGIQSAARTVESLALPEFVSATLQDGIRGPGLVGDRASGKDLLGVEVQAKALADYIAFKDMPTPFAVGLLGGWGSGKSFVFHLIKEQLKVIQKHDLRIEKDRKKFPFVGHIYLVKFDAWTFGKGNLWASLMYTIMVELNDQLHLESIISRPMDEESSDEAPEPESQDNEEQDDEGAEEKDEGGDDEGEDSPAVVVRNFVSNARNWYSKTRSCYSAFQSIVKKCRNVKPRKSSVMYADDIPLTVRPSTSADDDDGRQSLLLKGVSIIELMDELGKSQKEYLEQLKKDGIFLSDEMQNDIERYDLKTGSITEALVNAVDDQAKSDKDTLKQKKKELAWKYIECKSRLNAKGVLYDMLAAAYLKYKENSSDDEVPDSIREAIDSFNWLEKNMRLFFALYKSPKGWLLCSLALLAAVLAAVLPWLVVVGRGLAQQVVSFLIPLATAFVSAAAKIRSTFKDLGPTFTRALDKAYNEEGHLQSGEWIDLEREDEKEATPLKLKQLRVEISALEQRVWIREGESLADVVKDRVESSDYEKQLGIVHKAQTDLQRLSEALVSNKSEKRIFPRGPPRIVIFIDDLDRCPPKKVVQTLEAVQLLVNTNLFVVVIAIDARFVTLSLEKEYEGILRQGGDPSGLDYLEKIIQLPYRIPPINREMDMETYLRDQMFPEDIVTKEESDDVETESDSESLDEESTHNGTAIARNTSPPVVQSAAQEPLTPKAHTRGAANAMTTIPEEEEDVAGQTTVPTKQIEFQEEELHALKQACIAVRVNPRAAKRLVNVFKLIKIIWYHRQGGKEVSKAVTEAFLLILAMCASKSKPMRLGMCKAFEKLEKKEEIKNDLAEFLVQNLGDALKGTCKELVEVKLNRYVLDWTSFEKEFWLVRSFSFVGEYVPAPGEEYTESTPLYDSRQLDVLSCDSLTSTSYRFTPEYAQYRSLEHASSIIQDEGVSLPSSPEQRGLRRRAPPVATGARLAQDHVDPRAKTFELPYDIDAE